MNNIRLYFIVVSLIVTGICYFASENIYMTVAVGLIFLIYPQAFLVKRIFNSQNIHERYHECYHFVNTFIVSLDIRGSLNGAFANINPTMNSSYLSVYEGIASNKSEDKLAYLKRYFPFHFYGLFVKVVTLWMEQGGDILSMSSHLLEEGRKSEEYLRHCQDLHLTKVIEFAVLWLFALTIVVVMRISLNQFFARIMGNVIYIVGLSLFFLFLLVSIEVMVRKISQKEVKGWDEYE